MFVSPSWSLGSHALYLSLLFVVLFSLLLRLWGSLASSSLVSFMTHHIHITSLLNSSFRISLPSRACQRQRQRLPLARQRDPIRSRLLPGPHQNQPFLLRGCCVRPPSREPSVRVERRGLLDQRLSDVGAQRTRLDGVDAQEEGQQGHEDGRRVRGSGGSRIRGGQGLRRSPRGRLGRGRGGRTGRRDTVELPSTCLGESDPFGPATDGWPRIHDDEAPLLGGGSVGLPAFVADSAIAISLLAVCSTERASAVCSKRTWLGWEERGNHAEERMEGGKGGC